MCPAIEPPPYFSTISWSLVVVGASYISLSVHQKHHSGICISTACMRWRRARSTIVSRRSLEVTERFQQPCELMLFLLGGRRGDALGVELGHQPRIPGRKAGVVTSRSHLSWCSSSGWRL